RVIAQKFLL
ncbi:amino acid kinase family protein, partial [Chlamydia psittaci 03DC29]